MAVKRVDELFYIEREINGLSAEERPAIRAERCRTSLADLEVSMRAEWMRLSRHVPVARAMAYILMRWPGFTRSLDDGLICLTNNVAERVLRGITLGRKASLFAGSDLCGHIAAHIYISCIYILIVMAKMNNLDPLAWLANVLARIAERPSHRLAEPLHRNWKQTPGCRHTGRIAHASRRCPISSSKRYLAAALTEWLPLDRAGSFFRPLKYFPCFRSTALGVADPAH